MSKRKSVKKENLGKDDKDSQSLDAPDILSASQGDLSGKYHTHRGKCKNAKILKVRQGFIEAFMEV